MNKHIPNTYVKQYHHQSRPWILYLAIITIVCFIIVVPIMLNITRRPNIYGSALPFVALLLAYTIHNIAHRQSLAVDELIKYSEKSIDIDMLRLLIRLQTTALSHLTRLSAARIIANIVIHNNMPNVSRMIQPSKYIGQITVKLANTSTIQADWLLAESLLTYLDESGTQIDSHYLRNIKRHGRTEKLRLMATDCLVIINR